ncbi:MAG: hypothetical protein AAF974_08515, partial [Cyanobacteria bacterium P01_E01_bin.34]
MYGRSLAARTVCINLKRVTLKHRHLPVPVERRAITSRALPTMPEPSYYDCLGVAPWASLKEIRRAYR